MEPGQGSERAQVSQAQITGNAEHRRVEIVRVAIDSGKESGQLELSYRDIESGISQPSLQHLLQGRLATPDGEQLEPGPPSRRAGRGGPRHRNGKIPGSGRRNRP